MDDYRLQTPEQVNISYTVAGLGTRFLAIFIDTLIQEVIVIILLLSIIPSLSLDFNLSSWYIGIMIVVFLIITQGYFFIFELLLKGRTPGKAIMKIRVVRKDGRPVDVAGTLLRNLLRIIDVLPGMYAAGVITMFINKDSRRLGDLAAGTVVIVEGKKTSLGSILAQQGSLAYSELSNEEYALVRDYNLRRNKLTPRALEKLSASIAAPIYEKLDIPMDQRDDPDGFLQSLIEDEDWDQV